METGGGVDGKEVKYQLLGKYPPGPDLGGSLEITRAAVAAGS